MSDAQHKSPLWQVWVETGGTFTDCIARDPSGVLHRAKVLSSSALRGTVVEILSPQKLRVWERWNAPPDFVRGMPFALLGGEGQGDSNNIIAYDPATQTIELAEEFFASPGAAFEVRFPYEAPVLAARLVTGTPPDKPLPPLALRVATTRGTNALLTRKGTPPAFFVTSGFGDLLLIGTQQRPDLFALDIVKPAPLTGAVVEVDERLAADGSVVRPLNEAAVTKAAQKLVVQGVRTASVALMHSYRNPVHENRVAALLRAAGFTHVSVSSELSPLIKLLPRAQTAVVNAYLAPLMDAYLDGIGSELIQPAKFDVMTSAGGLVRHSHFQPKDSLLSGPAGGVVGALHAGRAAGYPRIIAFDMGGTSTDVARCDNALDYVWEHTVGDAHLVAPALAIESVASGGGSICYADRHGLHVGPQSAGANPGPACYGAGGPLTITDVNLLLGRLDADRFEIPIDRAAAEQKADALLADITQHTGETPDRDAVLRGLLDIANERMADAIRRISLRRGYDPAHYALLAFGGAGEQHACAVAAKLGIRTVLLPPDASLLSAWGLGQAEIGRFAEKQILRPLTEFNESAFAALAAELQAQAINAVKAEGVEADAIETRRPLVTLRLAGQETGIEIEWAAEAGSNDSLNTLKEAFAERYQAVYGYRPASNRIIEVEAVRVAAAAATETAADVSDATQTVLEMTSVRAEDGWTITRHPSGAMILSATGETAGEKNSDAPEAVREALFAGRFTALAEEMGEALRRTALSTNVKERLDFSCALLDPHGFLVANAAHIPVHLGSLGVCVRSVCQSLVLGPGDVAVTNHPAWGGSHLPDVTVITPVFDDANAVLLGYVASRAHHAEIGGTRPGSMPPGAKTLAEEGVVLAPAYLVWQGQSRLDAVCETLTDAPFPTRAIGDNRADLEAALAANRQGSRSLSGIAREQGTAALWQAMERVQTRAERLLRDALLAMEGDYAATEHLDDGTPLAVRITVRGDSATVDFSGTGPTHPGNLNATPAIAASAVLYVLRLLVREPVPLNEGLLRPITLLLPPGTLVNPDFDLRDPSHCPAVVGGNTETSQRIVDALLRALHLAAGSQGTMNNTLYGNAAFGYYETVCGGAGATANAPGASVVHTHMTNTRITDAEIMELRFPVRVERFAQRAESGGAGLHRGGNGVVRETVFFAPLALSVLTQHRTSGPYGLAGGQPGKPGKQNVVRADGSVTELASVDGCDVEVGDRLIMETPGGGGWGKER